MLWGCIKGKGYSTQSGNDKLKPKARIGTAFFQTEEAAYVKGPMKDLTEFLKLKV